MALNIQGNIETGFGITLPSVYARTSYQMNDKSDNIIIMTDYWVDKNAYDNNQNPIQVSIFTDARFTYNRTTDGEDVLSFTQNKMKEQLEEQGFSVQITEL
jgi:hypothetical protein